MKFSDEEILSVIEDVTLMLGHVLLMHRELAEGVIEKNSIDRVKQRIDGLNQKLTDQKKQLARIRDAGKRKSELEKIRKDHENPINEGLSVIRDERGKVIGWIQSVSHDRSNILNSRGEVVARHVSGVTLDRNGAFRGYGTQGMRLLGVVDTKGRVGCSKRRQSKGNRPYESLGS